MSIVTHLDVVILGAGNDTDVATGGVCVVDGQHHDLGLVTARQLANDLEPVTQAAKLKVTSV